MSSGRRGLLHISKNENDLNRRTGLRDSLFMDRDD